MWISDAKRRSSSASSRTLPHRKSKDDAEIGMEEVGRTRKGGRLMLYINSLGGVGVAFTCFRLSEACAKVGVAHLEAKETKYGILPPLWRRSLSLAQQ